jgi:hypothetical protein
MNEPVSMEEVNAEEAKALPNKEVLSLLDVNANVDLGLDLAAPVDLAAAANLNVAAPIEAAATANVLSPDAVAVGEAQQHGTLDQTDSGTATAIAPQHAGVVQNSSTQGGGITSNAPTTADVAPANAGGPGTAGGGLGDIASGAGPAHDVAGGTQAAAPGSQTANPVEPTGTPATAPGDAASSTSGGVGSLLNGGSLLDANINVNANADLTAPIDGAVAANANVAAPVDAAVGANIGSAGAQAEALAPQELDISQSLDNVAADATATQDASVAQQ